MYHFVNNLFFLFLFGSSTLVVSQSLEDGHTISKGKSTSLDLAKVVESPSKGVTIIGNPLIVDCPYGKAVQFDGQGDAILFDTNFLAYLNRFTIEIIIRPDTNGQREQRFLHFGEVSGERVLIETRLTKDNHWYLDAFVKSKEVKHTLVDSLRLHPLNDWHHIAFIVDNGTLETYVNGKRELTASIPFTPFLKGETSIGARLNRINWFKGAMYCIRITPWIVEPARFIHNIQASNTENH
jgi:hypothetical protein